MEAEGAVTQHRTDDPGTDLTEGRVGKDKDCLAQRNAALGRASGHVGNDALAG